MEKKDKKLEEKSENTKYMQVNERKRASKERSTVDIDTLKRADVSVWGV